MIADLFVGDTQLIGHIADQQQMVVIPRFIAGGLPDGDGAVNPLAVICRCRQDFPLADLYLKQFVAGIQRRQFGVEGFKAVHIAVFGGDAEGILLAPAVNAAPGYAQRAGGSGGGGIQHVMGF